jgi:hypothetical protein
MNKNLLVSLVAFAALALNSAAFAGNTGNQDDCLVKRIAERHLVLYFPDFDSIKSPPVVQDMGSFWKVWYELPEGFVGGTPLFHIDKATLKVLKMYQEQ